MAHVNVKGTIIAETSINEHQNRPRHAVYTYKHPFSLTKNKQYWDLEKAVYEYDPNLPNVYCPIYRMKLVYTEISLTETYVDFYYDTDDNLPKSLSNNVLSNQNIFFSDLPVLSARENADIAENQLPEYVFFKNTSSIYRYKIEYDEQNGWDNKITFFNANTHPVNDSNGIYGYTQTHDEKGRVVQERYLYDNTSFWGFEKIDIKKLDYDDEDNLTKIAFYHVKNNTSSSPNVDKNVNSVSESMIFDEKDKQDKISIMDSQLMVTEDVLVLNETRNYAESHVEWKKVEDKLVQSISFFDAESNLCTDTFVNASQIENVYDSEGLKTKSLVSSPEKTVTQEILQLNSAAMPEKVLETDEDTKHIINYSYIPELTLPYYKICDESNNEIEKLTLSIKNEENACIITKQFESAGMESVTEKQIYDKYGRYIENTVVNKDKTTDINFSAKIIYRGDNKSICFYKDDEYYMQPNGGYARADFSYTNDGMISFAAFKDADGKMVNAKSLGFSKYSALYSPNTLLLQEEYRGADEKLIIPKNENYARYEAKNDINDKLCIEGRWFGLDGKLADREICRFDSEIDSKNGPIITYYNNDDVIMRQLFYTEGIISKTIDCWFSDDGKYYHKGTYTELGEHVYTIVYTSDGIEGEFFYEGDNTWSLIQYDSDGTKWLEALVKYDDDKPVYSVGNFSDGTKEEVFYKNAKPVHRILYFADGSKEQEIFSDYEDGKLVHKLTVCADGTKEEEFYEAGLCVHHIYYFADGSKEQEIFLDYKDNKLVHEVTVYADETKDEVFYENGKCVRDIKFASDGSSQGRFYEDENILHFIGYAPNGKKQEEYFLKLKDGHTISFSDDDMNSDIIIENTESIHFIEFMENGKKQKEFFFEYGKGFYIEYSTSGEKLQETFFELRDGYDIGFFLKTKNLGVLSKHESLESVHLIVYSPGEIKEEEGWVEFKNGKLVHSLVEYSDGNKEEEFYENGNCVHKIYYSAEGSKEEEFYENDNCVHKITYLADGSKNKEIFTEYKDGERIYEKNFYSDGKKVECFYKKDKCIHAILYGIDGSKKSEQFFEYKDDSCIYSLYISTDGDKCEEFYEDGNCVHKIDYSADGNKKEETFTEYKEGKRVYEITHYADGQKLEYFYDNNLNCVHKIDYNADGSKSERFYEGLNCIHEIDYSSDGNKEKEIFTDFEGFRRVHELTSFADGSKEEKFFDEHDNRVRMIRYTANGKKKLEEFYENHWNCVHKIEYSTDGEKEKEIFTDYNGFKRVHETTVFADGSKEERFFDKHDNCIHLIKYAADGKKEEEIFNDYTDFKQTATYADGSKIESFFDEHGNCIHLIKYTEDGMKEEEFFGEYDRDELVKLTIKYPDGRKKEEFYENDKLVHSIWYSANGEQESEEFY